MKKTLWMLGVAVAALTSCTQSEVLDVPESKMIGFEPFVGKSTRAAQMIQQAQRSGENALDNLYQFWVFGIEGGDVTLFNATDDEAKVYFKSDLGGFTYDNVKSWKPGYEYSFAAYSNGNKPLVTNAQGDVITTTPVTDQSTLGVTHAEIKNNQGNVTGSKLTFEDYVVGDDDLLAAIVKPNTVPADAQSVTPVPFNFQHMLSLVHIQLENNTADLYLQISDITFSGINKDDCVYKIEKNEGTGNFDKSVLWENMDTDSSNDGDAGEGEYKFIGTGVNAEGATDDAVDGASYLRPGDVIHLRYFVIPQNNQDKSDIDLIVYSYTYDAGATPKYAPSTTNNVTEHKISLAVSEVGHQSWQPGYQYHYSGSLSGQAHWIQFVVNSVDSWTTNENRPTGSVITN